MAEVLDENKNPVQTSYGATGWYGGIPVMWKYSLLLWLNPRELECFGRADDAFLLWKMLDPNWGEAWNPGIKEEFPIDLQIYRTITGYEQLHMIYVDGKPVPETKTLPEEEYWISSGLGSRKEAHWVDNCWKPFDPKKHLNTF